MFTAALMGTSNTLQQGSGCITLLGLEQVLHEVHLRKAAEVRPQFPRRC